jgi:alpha-L-fucosidase 2
LKRIVAVAITVFAVPFAASIGVAQSAAPSLARHVHAAGTTAWHDGRFVADLPGLIGRSAIVLERPNQQAGEAMPLGNGHLGVAVWSADGLTLQLNRADTLPRRLSTGQVVLPGLAALTEARDYSGRLDLYNGEFSEQGGGLRATVYVQPATDTLVMDVTGADPGRAQTAILKLWEPRAPHATASGATGMLAESWMDDKEPGASGRSFGSLSAITAIAQNVTATVTDTRTVTLRFTPRADGSFRILVASPHYDGTQDAAALVRTAFTDPDPAAHRAWWNGFWQRAGWIKASSADGVADYMENLRNIFLFSAAAENAPDAAMPGSQAGVGDMFSSVRDIHHWDPGAFWHWNLRMQIAAQLSAGLPELNQPYFRLYRDDLEAITRWTREHMEGRPGICVPETMRFNGPGYEYENWDHADTENNCDAGFHPYYNARTISTGAEIAQWIWLEYQATGDRAFLAANFPVMQAAARFLLAYEKPGADGRNHTTPTNAHETQWDVTDSTTDICARTVLYQSTLAAARLLRKDEALAKRLTTALEKIPPLPRTQPDKAVSLLTAADDRAGNDVIAASYQPAAESHNVENIGLEPVWPFSLIGDLSPLFALAQRTYDARPHPVIEDWSFDPIQAARLHKGDEVASTLAALTRRYQKFVNGFAAWGDPPEEFYVEQSGVVAAALAEALVEDYDGVIRVAPAIPRGWDFDGRVFVRGNTWVDVEVRDGAATTVAIEAGSDGPITLRNPWPGASLRVVDGDHEVETEALGNSGAIRFRAASGHSYRVEQAGSEAMPFAPISGQPARAPRSLGPVQIGLAAKP